MMLQTVRSGGIADKVLTGGLVANILLTAKGENIGKGSLDFIEKSGYTPFIDMAKELYGKYGIHIVLPVDGAYYVDWKRRGTTLGSVLENASLTDIGSETAAMYQDIILSSKTVFVNAPMWIFEDSEMEFGTRAVWDVLGDTLAYTVIG